MATLVELCESKQLVTIDVLEADELPWRTLYGTPGFIEWIDANLREVPHKPEYVGLSPSEQVYAVFAEYQSGERFSDDRRFKKLNQTPDNFIWEIKTEEVRIFGWVPQIDHFICCFGDGKDRILDLNLYGRYIAQSIYMRNNLPLDEPKYVVSKEYTDVVSDQTRR